MKNLFPLLLGSLALLLPARADYLVQPNDVVAVCGDSITEQHLYSAFIEDYLLMCQPTAGQKVVQFGWSGEQAPAFLARLGTDVFPFKPTVATTCYGMNDGHYGPIDEQIADNYRTAQTGIVEALKKNGVHAVVLGSAKCVDSYTYHDHDVAAAKVYNKTLGALADIDKEIAAKEGVPYADVFGITLSTMKKAKAKFGEAYNFAGPKGVHPGPNGQLVMAYAFLKALGCDGAIGKITVEPGLNKAEGSDGQQIVSCRDGTVTVTSTRYPFCFTGKLDDTDPGTTAAVTQFFPFNQDLNRFLLVVHGLSAAKAKVTWGGATKEFSGAQLEKGINLAAEFFANPFSEQFAKVNEAVGKQEVQETTLSKLFLHSVGVWKTTAFPGTDVAFNQIISAGMTQHEKLFQDAVNLVVPITHTIKIEVEK
jgi:lysophospholipase L1-like esterase